MFDDLISRKQAQEAILKSKAIMFVPDKEIAAKDLESVPAVVSDNASIEYYRIKRMSINELADFLSYFSQKKRSVRECEKFLDSEVTGNEN